MTEQNSGGAVSHALTQKQEPKNVVSLMQSDAIRQRIEFLLKDRASQFIASVSSLMNATPQLQACEPKSVLAACMTAAALDLPINKDLGFAHIIPYKSGRGDERVSLAQFQMGYKGFIQLAMRSGQYSRMNAVIVNKEAFDGYDDVGEPIIKWALIDETKDAVGYAFAFKLLNGFSKTIFWTVDKVMDHAERYSQSYRYDLQDKKKASLWSTNVPAMGLKTVIKAGLNKWGILSVDMQRALQEDQAARTDVDSPPIFPDNDEALALADGGPTSDAATKALTAKTGDATPPAEKDDLPFFTRDELVAKIEEVLPKVKSKKNAENAAKAMNTSLDAWQSDLDDNKKLEQFLKLLEAAK